MALEPNLAIIMSLTAYKIASLIVGLLFSYMGYKLFMSGIWGHAGEINSQLGDNKLVIKKAAPGTFFALFGAIIVGITVWKGLEFKDLENLPARGETPVKPHEQPNNLLPQNPPL